MTSVGRAKKLLEEMNARCEAATPGCWTTQEYKPKREDCAVWSEMNSIYCDGRYTDDPVAGFVARQDDRTFIAHARTDLPRTIRALQAALHLCDFASYHTGTQSKWVDKDELERVIADVMEEKAQ